MVTRPGPLLFCYSHDFEGERGRPVEKDLARADFKVVARSERVARQYAALFNTVGLERHGRLHGEYAYVNTHLLIDGDGNPVLVNSNGDDYVAILQVQDFWVSDGCQAMVEDILRRWHALPVVRDSSLLGEPYAWNYFHFTTLMIPKVRFFADTPSSVIDQDSLKHPFQRKLLLHLMETRKLFAINDPCRIVDPLVAQTTSFRDNVRWLQDNMPFCVSSGGRRIFIRRGRGSRKLAGDIAPTPQFEAVLKDFGFETVQFGDGDMAVDEQVAMLKDAGIILGAHGAHLTNMAYVRGPATLVEILPPMSRHLTLSAYMDLAHDCGFRYRGLVAEGYDDAGSLYPDCELLFGILNDICGG